MADWTPHPHTADFAHLDEAQVRRLWPRLHAGDAEPLPADAAVLQAWTLLHRGDLAAAAEAGMAAGPAGLTVANRATCLYASYLEPREERRLALFQEVAQRAERQAAREPSNAAAHYLLGYALGRRAQAISVAKALAQGLGQKVKEAFETAIRLRPRHADAHIALATFHAEVIDKVGVLIGGMTYGASRSAGRQLFEDGLRLHPDSAIAMVEMARGLLMLDGDAQAERANALHEQAARVQPLDAVQWLEVHLAQAELQDS